MTDPMIFERRRYDVFDLCERDDCPRVGLANGYCWKHGGTNGRSAIYIDLDIERDLRLIEMFDQMMREPRRRGATLP